MASALTRVLLVDLFCTSLTSDQVAALMEPINQGNSSIEKLSLLESVPEEDWIHGGGDTQTTYLGIGENRVELGNFLILLIKEDCTQQLFKLH